MLGEWLMVSILNFQRVEGYVEETKGAIAHTATNTTTTISTMQTNSIKLKLSRNN